jgi:hypothetical protein
MLRYDQFRRNLHKAALFRTIEEKITPTKKSK